MRSLTVPLLTIAALWLGCAGVIVAAVHLHRTEHDAGAAAVFAAWVALLVAAGRVPRKNAP